MAAKRSATRTTSSPSVLSWSSTARSTPTTSTLEASESSPPRCAAAARDLGSVLAVALGSEPCEVNPRVDLQLCEYVAARRLRSAQPRPHPSAHDRAAHPTRPAPRPGRGSTGSTAIAAPRHIVVSHPPSTVPASGGACVLAGVPRGGPAHQNNRPKDVTPTRAFHPDSRRSARRSHSKTSHVRARR